MKGPASITLFLIKSSNTISCWQRVKVTRQTTYFSSSRTCDVDHLKRLHRLGPAEMQKVHQSFSSCLTLHQRVLFVFGLTTKVCFFSCLSLRACRCQNSSREHLEISMNNTLLWGRKWREGRSVNGAATSVTLAVLTSQHRLCHNNTKSQRWNFFKWMTMKVKQNQAQERAVLYCYKKLFNRAKGAFGGPIFNFLFYFCNMLFIILGGPVIKKEHTY